MATDSNTVKPVDGESLKQNKPRSERWTTMEIVTLINYVKEKGGVLFGSGGGHGVEGRKKKAWTEVAEEVEGVGTGVERGGWEGARRKWQDLAFRSKKYLKDKIGSNVTGGGPQPPVNDLFESVLDVLPSAVTHGITPPSQCETVPTVPVSYQHAATCSLVKTITEVIPVSPSTAGMSGIHVGLQQIGSSTETESSQDQSQEQQSRKRKKTQKASKGLGKKRKQESTKKTTKDITLLEMNRNLLELEEKKMGYKESKLQLQREMIDVLKNYNANIEKLVPPVIPIDLTLLNTMQTEQ